MPKLMIFFLLSIGFGLVFQLLVVGSSHLQLGNAIISFNLSEVLLAILLASNLFALLLLLRRPSSK